MPKISVHLGVTLPIPGQDYSSLRVDVQFDDIDPERDVQEQLDTCEKLVLQTTEVAERALLQQATNMSGVSLDGGLAKKVERLTSVVQRIIEHIKRAAESE